MISQIQASSPSSASSSLTESVECKSEPCSPSTTKTNQFTSVNNQLDFKLTGNDYNMQQHTEEHLLSAHLKIRIENLINSLWKDKDGNFIVVNSSTQLEFVLKLFELIFSTNFKSNARLYFICFSSIKYSYF
jgi:hypothetical protein